MRTQRRTLLLLALLAAPRILAAQVVMAGSARGGPVIVNGNGNGNDGMISLDLPTADPPSTTDRIDGVVVSSIDLKPVARVLVTTADRRFATLTDYEGRFSFDLRRPLPDSSNASTASTSGIPGYYQPPTQPVQFQLRKPGYVNGAAMVNFPSTRPDGPQPHIQLTIQPASSLTGRVDIDAGVLPANVTVQIRRRTTLDGRSTWNNFISNARVDPQGNFRAGDLPPGDYKIQALASSVPNPASRTAPDTTRAILPAFYPDAPTLDAAAPIHIAPGENANANLILRSAPFYRVTIPVGGDGADQGLRVNLTPSFTGISLSYNPADRMIQGYLPNGDYELHLISNGNPFRAGNSPPEQLTATTHIHVSGAPVHAATPVTLHPIPEIPVDIIRDYTPSDTSNNNIFSGGSQDFSDPNLRRDYSFSLQPTVQDGSQFIAQNNGRGRQPNPPTSIRASGGAYDFVFNCGDCYAASITSGGMDLLQQPLVIDDNVAPQPIQVTLRNDFAFINVHLASSAAAAAAPATALSAGPVAYILEVPLDRLESRDLGPFGIFPPNSPSAMRNNGTYPYRLPPGHYLVLAARDAQSLATLAYRDPDTLRALTAQGVTVNLSPGEKTDIEVPLLPAPNSPGDAPAAQQIIYAGAQ